MPHGSQDGLARGMRAARVMDPEACWPVAWTSSWDLASKCLVANGLAAGPILLQFVGTHDCVVLLLFCRFRKSYFGLHRFCNSASPQLEAWLHVPRGRWPAA
jgi:hypothetical protein